MILLNRWIFPIGQSGEASRWRVCYQRGLPRLVFININIFLTAYDSVKYVCYSWWLMTIACFTREFSKEKEKAQSRGDFQRLRAKQQMEEDLQVWEFE